LIVPAIVPGGGAGEEGGEGGGAGRGGGGAVQGGDDVGEDRLDPLREAALLGDALAVGGEEAGGAATLVGDLANDLSEEAVEGGEVEVLQGDEGGGRQRAALGDGGGAVGLVAGVAGEDHEVGGVALGDAALPPDQAAGRAGGDGLGRGELVAETGVTAVLEGVEVAGLGAGAGTAATVARRDGGGHGGRTGLGDVVVDLGQHRSYPVALFGCEGMERMF
jgi:hypothetical protein